MREALVPIAEDHHKMKEEIQVHQKKMPEMQKNISVCLSRIQKVKKEKDQNDDKISTINKLVSSLFDEVTSLLEANEGCEANPTFEALKNQIQEQPQKIVTNTSAIEKDHEFHIQSESPDLFQLHDGDQRLSPFSQGLHIIRESEEQQEANQQLIIQQNQRIDEL